MLLRTLIVRIAHTASTHIREMRERLAVSGADGTPKDVFGMHDVPRCLDNHGEMCVPRLCKTTRLEQQSKDLDRWAGVQFPRILDNRVKVHLRGGMPMHHTLWALQDDYATHKISNTLSVTRSTKVSG